MSLNAGGMHLNWLGNVAPEGDPTPELSVTAPPLPMTPFRGKPPPPFGGDTWMGQRGEGDTVGRGRCLWKEAEQLKPAVQS